MNAKNTALSTDQMRGSSGKNYFSKRKQSNNTVKGKTSKKSHMTSISHSTQDIVFAKSSSSKDEDKSNLISIGGAAGNFGEQHHPSAVKKSFQQFRRDTFVGMGGGRNKKLRKRMVGSGGDDEWHLLLDVESLLFPAFRDGS